MFADTSILQHWQFYDHNLFQSPAGFYKAKILHDQNHVRTSGLQSFLLSTSYNVHLMSNTII